MADAMAQVPVNRIGDVQVISSTLSSITFTPSEVSRNAQVTVLDVTPLVPTLV